MTRVKGSIVLSAGGTGGHFFPAIAFGEELRIRGYDVHLITDLRCKKYITPNLNLTAHVIDSKISTKTISGKILSIISIFIAIIKSLILLHKIKPSIIAGFGGYPTFPPLLAGVILRIPIIIHEQNCFIGKTNRFFIKFAKIIAVSYKETRIDTLDNTLLLSKLHLAGDLVRSDIKKLATKDNFNNQVFRIFVFGGSQGAKIFNTLIPEAIKMVKAELPELQLHVTQQVTADDLEHIRKIYSRLGVSYNLSEFFHNMQEHYANSELVICRSGASTIAELTSIGLPAIFIPYPHAADNHQFHNAKALESNQASWCFEQDHITPRIVSEKIVQLINNRDLLKKASMNLLKRKSDGVKILGDTVEKIIQ